MSPLPGRPAPSRESAARLVTPLFLLVQTITFLYFTAVGALLPTLPRFVDDVLGGSRLDVGIIVGAFGISALALRPGAGRFGDRRGRRILVVAGGIVVAASVGAYTLTTSVLPLLALRLVTGAGEALFFVGIATVVNDLAPDARRGEALSFFSLALFGGIAVGPVVGERLLESSGYDPVWLVAGALCAAAAMLGLLLPDTRDPGTATAVSGRLVHPAALVPGLVILAGLIGQAGFEAFAALYAFDLGMASSRAIFVVYAVVLLVVRSLGARIPDRVGPRRTAGGALVLSVVALVVLALWSTVPGLFTGTVLLALGHAFVFPAVMSMAVASVPATERGSLIGTFTAFVDLSFALGGVVLGAVANAGGYAPAFLAAAAIAALGFVLLTRYRPPRVSPAGVDVAVEPQGM